VILRMWVLVDFRGVIGVINESTLMYIRCSQQRIAIISMEVRYRQSSFPSW
jgi:hypothetical protein